MKIVERGIERHINKPYSVRILVENLNLGTISPGTIPESVTVKTYDTDLGTYLELTGDARDVIECETRIVEMDYTMKVKDVRKVFSEI
ncbi:MAG: hypothetical protein APG12_00708 [Candidatus Methanofastidiosum methylothiophilum]|uniref:Uncharacterized protein n=1 Tax=Candidatus Methanofastidiosum methylothiophilum TaxID=1705564 RepID=A0A150ISL0_9EURY|nr:MAG: hypothetical protein APG10_00656 [Candidatus Methanofastidiosum methylthiophilus]KYC47956.1 MAG: hypothetical protein APG11_00731 [Candidatus Methanofastidiosum methylthiophilus]KYC50574.1 MAG: hypothetical protein APG12_00708 [Candidatus Methanofastidiosum methylthiophilus]